MTNAERCSLEALLQESFDVLPARRRRTAHLKRIRTSGIEACRGMTLTAPDQPKHRSKPHLWVRVLVQRHLRDPRNVGADLVRPADQALGRPLAVVAMRRRSVRLACHRASLRAEASSVTVEALSAVPDLDDGRRRANLHALANQRVRSAVVPSVEADVVVDVDASAGPLAWLEATRGELLQRRLIDALERSAARAGQLLERARVQLIDKLRDRDIELVEAEEAPVS